jgi:hypothetical protein
MSVSEYAQIMKEVGIISSSSGGAGKSGSSIVDNKIQVEHIVIFDVTERWEKICKAAVVGFFNLGRHMVDSVRIVAIAGSIGIVLWGCSSLVTSLRSKRLSQGDGTEQSP